MINDNILLFILSIVLIYVFDHKIIPTLGIVTFNMIEIYIIVVINVATITEIDGIYTFLYAVSLIYAAYMIFVSPIEDTTAKKEMMQ